MNKDDKIALVGTNEIAKTTLFKILMGEMEADSGTFKWGITTSQAYFPKDNSEYFENSDLNLSRLAYVNFHQMMKAKAFYVDFLGRMLIFWRRSFEKSKCPFWWRKSSLYAFKNDVKWSKCFIT